jgi:hypothetical protein
MLTQRAPGTLQVPLPGGQSRLRNIILYVARKCEGARYFGAIKLNKIIWKADFDAYASRRRPVTGREYRRRYFGPAPLEMLPVHRDLLRDGLIRVDNRAYGDGLVEKRTVALAEPDLRDFTSEDLAFVDASIRHWWDKTGTETSDASHGVAWRTRQDNDPMPYELALLSDEPLDLPHQVHAEELIYNNGWNSA